MKRKKVKKMSHNQISMEIQYYLSNGGEIQVLPPQLYIPLSRVNCASPYLDYRDSSDDFSFSRA